MDSVSVSSSSSNTLAVLTIVGCNPELEGCAPLFWKVSGLTVTWGTYCSKSLGSSRCGRSALLNFPVKLWPPVLYSVMRQKILSCRLGESVEWVEVRGETGWLF